jgi:hypothetical protein
LIGLEKRPGNGVSEKRSNAAVTCQLLPLATGCAEVGLYPAASSNLGGGKASEGDCPFMKILLVILG